MRPLSDPRLIEAFEMEDLEITDYDVYNAQPQDILAARLAIRSERARLHQIEMDAAMAQAGRR